MPPIATKSVDPKLDGRILQVTLSMFLAALLVMSLLLATTNYAWAAKDGKKHKDEKGSSNQDSSDNNKHNPKTSGKNGGAQEGRQQPPSTPKKFGRTLGDHVSVTDTIDKASANFARYLSDEVEVGEAGQGLSVDKILAPVDMGLELLMSDQITATGIANVPALPRITVTSAPMLQASENQGASITFDSTATGTYSIAIVSDDGISSADQTIKGNMQPGANSALWQAKDRQGKLLPSGPYSYYITAQNGAGVRTPPAEGDGQIIVVASSPSSSQSTSMPSIIDTRNLSGIIILAVVAVVAGIAAAIYIFSLRKRRSITLYLPAEAFPVIDEIKQRYPDAIVKENYIDKATDGGVKRCVAVKIGNSRTGDDEKDDDDDAWLSEIVDKAKKLADVETVNLRYHGRIRVL